MHFCSANRSSAKGAAKGEPKDEAHLEQIARFPHDVEQEPPPRDLRLPRAPDDDLQRLVKVVQELDDARQDRVFVLALRLGNAVAVGEERGRRARVGFVFEDGVEEDLERMGKVDEILVVGGELDGLFALVVSEVKAEDVVNKKMCLEEVEDELASGWWKGRKTNGGDDAEDSKVE